MFDFRFSDTSLIAFLDYKMEHGELDYERLVVLQQAIMERRASHELNKFFGLSTFENVRIGKYDWPATRRLVVNVRERAGLKEFCDHAKVKVCWEIDFIVGRTVSLADFLTVDLPKPRVLRFSTVRDRVFVKALERKIGIKARVSPSLITFEELQCVPEQNQIVPPSSTV